MDALIVKKNFDTGPSYSAKKRLLYFALFSKGGKNAYLEKKKIKVTKI
jgi:hypothetical protein